MTNKSAKKEQVEQVEQTTTEQVKLTIDDLDLCKRIIALASRRGAFQADEMSAVGSVFDKLSAFIDMHKEATEPTEGENP